MNLHGMRPSLSWRNDLGIGTVTAMTIPDSVLADRLRRGATNHSTITASVFGDPLPGESALERAPEVIIAPYDPSRNYMPYQSSNLPRETRRQAMQVKLSSRNGQWRTAAVPALTPAMGEP